MHLLRVTRPCCSSGCRRQLQGALTEVLGGDLMKAFMAVRRCEAQHDASVDKLLLRF